MCQQFNLIHASANGEDAVREIKIMFSDEELHTYAGVHECVVHADLVVGT